MTRHRGGQVFGRANCSSYAARSILDRSSTSLISRSRCLPLVEDVGEELRFAPPRPGNDGSSRLPREAEDGISWVRSSWLILDKKLDLCRLPPPASGLSRHIAVERAWSMAMVVGWRSWSNKVDVGSLKAPEAFA